MSTPEDDRAKANLAALWTVFIFFLFLLPLTLNRPTPEPPRTRALQPDAAGGPFRSPCRHPLLVPGQIVPDVVAYIFRKPVRLDEVVVHNRGPKASRVYFVNAAGEQMLVIGVPARAEHRFNPYKGIQFDGLGWRAQSETVGMTDAHIEACER